MKNRYFAWIDIETTGLNPKKDHILEIACVITDDSLRIHAVFDELVKPPLRVRLFPRRYMDAYVFNMHSDNGLLEDCPEGESISKVGKSLCRFLTPWQNTSRNEHTSGTELYFVGNSIGALDLPFLREHVPEVMDLVHYRSMDITGLRLGLEQIFNNQFYSKRGTAVTHRALDDVYNAIDQLKSYKKEIGKIIQTAINLEKVPHTF